jgi:GNAT superfamily N-acetyltransferase
MLWRMGRAQFERQKGPENKRAFQAIVESGPAPGLLGYADSRPIAWCAVGPRDAYPALERSRVLARIDGAPAWSIVCLFVARPFRRQGITVPMLKAAVEYAGQRGARIVEGYPVEPKTANMPAAFAWTGTASTFRQAGFSEVARRSATRPIMRHIL